MGKMESYYIGAESVPDGDIGSTNDTAIPILAESTSPKPSEGNELQTVAKTSQAGEQKSENIPASQNAAAKSPIEAKSENPSEQAVKPKDAEAAAQSAVGDTAAQVKSAAEIADREMTKQAFRTEKLYQGKYELAKTLSNGMIMFEDNTVPERFSDAKIDYLKSTDDVNREIQEIRKQGDVLKQQYGDFHGKAYMAGMLSKVAGGVGTVVDGYELGRRANVAYESGKDSDWDAVTGQIAKMATNMIGGTLAVGGGVRLVGALAAGFLPTTGVVILSVVAGGVITYLIGKAADYIESEISKGQNPFSFYNDPSKGETEVAFVGDIDFSKYGDDTSMTSEGITLIGNQKFGNLEIKSKSLNIIGEVHTEGKLIVDSEKVEMTDLKALTQPVQTQREHTPEENLEAQNDVEVQQREGADDDAQTSDNVLPSVNEIMVQQSELNVPIQQEGDNTDKSGEIEDLQSDYSVMMEKQELLSDIPSVSLI